MTTSLEEVLQRLKEGEDPTRMSWSLLPPDEQQVLRRCALVHAFDQELLSKVLDPQGRIPFERWVEHPRVQQVPGRRGLYRLREEDRQWLREDWRQEGPLLRALSKALAEHFRARGEDWVLERLYHLLDCEPEEARALCLRLWEEAERRFLLTRCNDLLAILNEQADVLDPELQQRTEEWRQHLRTRSLWADEYTRTGRFQERREFRERLESLIGESSPWILHLHAMGGMGKSILLRWAIARWCVPAHIPCGRIDFDFMDPVSSTRQPWRILLELARQLDVQLPHSPFQGFIHWLGEYSAISRRGLLGGGEAAEEGSARATHLERLRNEAPDRFLSILRETWSQRPVLLILDTLEEALLRPGADLERVLLMFEQMQASHPRLRLLLSGRYDLHDHLSDFAARMGSRMETWQVPLFTRDEARAYLSEKRGLAEDPRLEVVLERFSGTPMKLALYADLLQANPDLSTEELRTWKDVDLLYLIDRVVERIGNPRVRWLLRYGVIPRRLTPAFIEEVMAPYLRESMSGTTQLDHPAEDALPKSHAGVFQMDLLQSPHEPVDFRALWQELTRYAGAHSWVSQVAEWPDTLVFHSEVLHPMRGLLQRHEVFRRLHRDAAAHFERKAEQEPARWMELKREATYHRFQLEGASAEVHWRTWVEEARTAGNWSAAYELASEVFGPDYLDEKNQPRCWADGSPMIALETLALASYLMAWNGIELLRSAPPERHEDLEYKCWFAINRLMELQNAMGEQVISPLRIQALYGFLQAPSDPKNALALIEQALAAAVSPQEQLEVELRYGDILSQAWRPFEAREHYRRALALMSEGGNETLRTRLDTLERFAREAMRAGQFTEARDAVEAALTLARQSGHWDNIPRLLLQLAGLELEAGAPAKAFAILSTSRVLQEGGESEPEERMSAKLLRARAFLELRAPLEALEICKRLVQLLEGGRAAHGLDSSQRPRLLALARETFADSLVALLEPAWALEELRLAEGEWNRLGSMEGVMRCRTRIARIQLHEFDDLLAVQQTVWEEMRSDMKQQGEEWVRMSLVRVEVWNETEGDARGRQRIDSLLEQTSSGLPTLQVQISLQGLGLNNTPETQGRYLAVLLSQLERIQTPAARLALLEPLRTLDLELPPESAERLMFLVNQPGLPIGSDKDLPLQDLRRVEVLRLCGRRDEAEQLLLGTATHLMSRGRRFALREILQAEDRLGWRSPKLLALLEEFDNFLQEFGAHELLCGALLVEHAERLHGHIGPNKKLGPEWKRASENKPELLDPAWVTNSADERLSLLDQVPPGWRLRLDFLVAEFVGRAPIMATIPPTPGEVPQTGSRRAGRTPRKLLDLELSSMEHAKGGRLLARATVQYEPRRPTRGRLREVDPDVPELQQQLMSEGEVFSYALLKRFAADWWGVSEQLGNALLEPKLQSELRKSPGQLDVRVSLGNLRLAPIPWELLMVGGHSQQRLLSLSSPTRFFYRTVTPSRPSPARHKTPTRSTSSRVVLVGDPYPRQDLRMRMHSRIQRAKKVYQQHGIEPIIIGAHLDELARELSRNPAVVHICANLEESPSLGGIFLDLDPWHFHGTSRDSSLSPSALDRMLNVRILPPSTLVVLDVERRPGLTETLTQLFLRNAFAAELFALGSTAAVLGIGLGEEREHESMVRMLAEALTRGRSIGALSVRLRAAIRELVRGQKRFSTRQLRLAPLEEIVASVGTVLFTEEPEWVPLSNFKRRRVRSRKKSAVPPSSTFTG